MGMGAGVGEQGQGRRVEVGVVACWASLGCARLGLVEVGWTRGAPQTGDHQVVYCASKTDTETDNRSSRI